MPLRAMQGTPIPAPPPSAAAFASAPPGAAATMLSIPYVRQVGDNWCWAACCEMVFSQAPALDPLTQCDLAEEEFRGGCCNVPVSNACDQPNWPDTVYNRHQFNYVRESRALSFDEVKKEINANRPVEVYYAWNTAGAHVAVIVGYYANGDVEVYDPWKDNGPGPRAFDFVLAAYGRGAWTMSYSGLGASPPAGVGSGPQV
jgi:hypothetical protein